MKIGALSMVSKVEGLSVWRIHTLVALWAKTKAAEFLALSFTTQVEGVSELALVALLAEAALVMLADQMANSRSLVWRSVVSIRAGRAKRTVAVLVGSACRTVVLVGEGEGREGCFEIWQEGQLRDGGAGRVEDVISNGSGHVACWTEMDGGAAGVRRAARAWVFSHVIVDRRHEALEGGGWQIRGGQTPELDAGTGQPMA